MADLKTPWIRSPADKAPLVNDAGAMFACDRCPCEEPPANPCAPDPGIDVTLTWAGAPATRSFLGQTFTSGQTHVICPTLYSCQNIDTPTTFYKQERWHHSISAAHQLVMHNRYAALFGTLYKYGTFQIAVAITDHSTAKLRMYGNYTPFGATNVGTITSTNIYSKWTTASAFLTYLSSTPYLVPLFFGSLVTGTGSGVLTIAWSKRQASEWNACGL